MKINYPAKSIAYLRNKLLFLYNCIKAISNTGLFNVTEEKHSKVFTPKLTFKHIKNKIFVFDKDTFKNQPVFFKNNFFYTISGSAIFCNLSIIMRHMRRPPTASYALRHLAYNTNFNKNIKLQKTTKK